MPVSSPPIPNGMVRVDGGTITGVGVWDGSEANDLGDVALMPGLINSHCHLDYTVLRGAIPPEASFSKWVRRLNVIKRTLSDTDYVESIRAGFAELRKNGTTTVLNIESFPDLMARIPPPPMRTWWFYEMMDAGNRICTEDAVAGVMSSFGKIPGWLGGFGLSPHAPYTTSPNTYRLARFCCEKYGLPFTTHLAESDEEFAMFRHGGGPLHRLLQSLGRNMSDTGLRSPAAQLAAGQALPDGALLAHVNFLEERDWEILRGRRFSIVHCPCCHEYFGRPPFPLARFLQEGFNVCLGTDSLASNGELNLFAEMRCLRDKHTGIRPPDLLDMVTQNAARAIGMEGKLGQIRAGALADLIALPFSGDPGAAPDSILEHGGAVDWMMIAGHVLPPP